MVAPAAIAVGAQVFGSVLGGISGRKSSRAAKRAAAEAARAERLVTEERLIQIDQEERAVRGTTMARAAGSGSVVGSGSVLAILAEQAREFERERSITRRAGASRVRATLAQGDAIASQARAQGLGSLFQGLSSAAWMGYQGGLFTKTSTGA
jgi:hypothetical protein